ncbi:hypothetical protein scyTo_0008919 [Scyliorhinus torazame]|uniref:FIST C-domain domain-containing protein n=1 Tax=Scyliorhinus torazame TaxID=75743 RepID=A0A401PF90_SCYTO|nr:hypothetical protein [Scyliorhinus torazame]
MHQRLTWISTKGHTYIGEEDGDHFLVKKMIVDLEEVYLVPDTVLYMAGTDTFSVQSANKRKKERRDGLPKKSRDAEVAAKLENLLPMECKTVGVSCPGIVCLRDNPELRVVFLFGYNTFKPAAADFIQRLTRPFNVRNTVVVGGHVDRVFSPSSESIDVRHMYGFVGLSLSGRPIQAASILLDEDVETAKSAEAAMQRLKAANIPETNTVGFMFACIGRGQNYYSSKENVEADAFRKQFPGIPLFGFFGNGEIGCDRIVTEHFSLRECGNSADCDELLHGYTTVMALLHLGPIK